MTHLGVDVAAFVDGQLPPAREAAARLHLEGCDRCRALVAEQEHLKRRMVWGSPAPAGVPPRLAAALSAVASSVDDPDPRGRQVLQRSVGVVVALVGSSAAVLLLAYVLAPPVATEGDPVTPDFAAYTTQFLQEAAVQRADADTGGSVPDVVRASLTSSRDVPLSSDELDELDADGWPCHATLAGDLDRVEGRLVDDTAVALRYSGEHVELHLIEQVGSLDESDLTGFQRTTVADSVVWVREGLPTVAAWEADGVVYTVVTDASIQRIAQVVAQLPSTPARSVVERVEDGLHRMTGLGFAA